MADSTDLRPLVGKVCLVTGATRGIGKGIALQLGEAGATVYITGRTMHPPEGRVGGSLQETSKEIESRGGKCIPIVCDHSVDEQVKALFETIKTEQNGQLDVLVNNAYAAVTALFDQVHNKKFYETDPEMWDTVNNVGLRNHYFCTVYASRLMVPRKQGLIVNVSSPGGLRYLFNVAYGVGKEACDRMAADCAHELRESNVAMVSLWPLAVSTEKCVDLANTSDTMAKGLKEMFQDGESTEFSGKCIASLAADPMIMSKTGKVLSTGDLGDEYNLLDIDGRKPPGIGHIFGMLNAYGYKRLAAITPRFMKIPKWLIALGANRM